MALGAVTEVDHTVFGTKIVRFGTGLLTSGGNYAADGEPITAATFGLSQLHFLFLSAAGTAALAVVLIWDKANSKILAYTSAGDGDPLDEATANDDFSTYTYNWVAVGV